MIIRGKDGSIIQVGSEHVEVGDFKLKYGDKLVAEPEAVDIFKFTIERLTNLIAYGEKLDEQTTFLVKSTISQLAIVSMASALEIYGKKRLLEIEASGGIRDWDAVLQKTGLSREELQKRATVNSRTPLEELIEERRLNSDNLDEFGRLFEKGTGIRVSDIDRKEIYRLLQLRHSIVHGGLRSDILYMENGLPVFAKPERARDFMRELVSFVEIVHKRSLEPLP